MKDAFSPKSVLKPSPKTLSSPIQSYFITSLRRKKSKVVNVFKNLSFNICIGGQLKPDTLTNNVNRPAQLSISLYLSTVFC